MKDDPRASFHIRRSREFECILARGRKVRGEYFELYISPNGQSPGGRFGITIRRRAGTAAARNRSKRLLRETFRLWRGQLPPGVDLIVAVHKDLSAMKLREVEGLFSEMIAKSGLGVTSEAV